MAIQMLKITSVVLGYWAISISLVFANKYLVGHGGQDTSDVSLFVAWIQCIITVVVVIFMKGARAMLTGDWSVFSTLSLRTMMSKQVLLMTCSFVCMLSFNNLCLRNVGVSFYQVARSLTLIFTVIFSVTILKKSVSRNVLLCCLTVASGFFLGVDQESLMGTLSVSGVLFGVTSSLFVALNGIFTKKALDVVEGDTVHLTLYSNMNAVVLFIPVVVGTGQMSAIVSSQQLRNAFFLMFLLTTGALSFLIAWISALQIHLTSPVTHHISSNTKAVLQTLLAVVYYHESKRLLWWVSILLVVGGALSYALVRIQEDKVEKSAKLLPDKDPAHNGLMEVKTDLMSGSDSSSDPPPSVS